MLCAATLALLPALLTPKEIWSGEFVFSITGKGKATGPKPNWGEWDINREAKGKIILSRTFRGAGLARSEDSRNEQRYETWVGETKEEIDIHMNDRIYVYGPLFAENQIRGDTYLYQVPKKGSESRFAKGKVAAAILQIDFKTNTFTFESPRYYGTVFTSFKREFLKGPKSWTDKKPILKEEDALEFEMIHGLNQPDQFFRITGSFKEGQVQIDMTKNHPFTVPLGASVKAQNLKAKFSLILKRTTQQ